MQFKIITSVLLFFIAQTMAAPNPQTTNTNSSPCTLPSTVGFALEVKTNHVFSADTAGSLARLKGGPPVVSSKLILAHLFSPKLTILLFSLVLDTYRSILAFSNLCKICLQVKSEVSRASAVRPKTTLVLSECKFHLWICCLNCFKHSITV